MADLPLSMAGYIYLDRTRALQLGQVKPAGIDLTYVPLDIGELFRRVAQHADFDVAEMSTSTYMMMLGQGDDRLVGLPVFFSRAFRHSQIYVHVDSGIERPEDLRGKDVGIPEYQMTAGLWIRAFLEHDYGVHPSEIRWWYGGINAPGYVERRHHEPPPGVHLKEIPKDKFLTGMLESGEHAAFVSAAPPAPFLRKSPSVRRLFPNWVDVEREYFQRTGFFPIMHMTVVRRDVYEQNPWVIGSLMDALVESKRRGLARLRNVGAFAVTLPWIGAHIDELDEVFGGDAFPYGYEQNAAILDAMMQYSFEQGLTPRTLTPEEMFPPEALAHPGDGLPLARFMEVI